VIEAALEAELVEHLDESRQDDARLSRRRNSRNGNRPKTVRTVVGPVEIDAPRDRWGTFDPMTVGKWQREVVGIDRLLMLLAAKGAPPQQVVDLLSQVYPPDVPEGTLHRIAATTRARLAEWHDRRLDEHFPVLHVHVSALQTQRGQVAGFPFVAVVGVAETEDGSPRRELLSLHALLLHRAGEQPWQHVVSDLRRRGVGGVRAVFGEGSALLRAAVVNAWPCATVTDRPPTGLLAS
jgi:transposase-like protein